MSSISLTYYLKDAEKLNELSVKDLSKLSEKYPFCEILRALLARKVEQSPQKQSIKGKLFNRLSLFNNKLSKLQEFVFKSIPKEIKQISEQAAVIFEEVDTYSAAVVSLKPRIEEETPKLAVAQLKVQQESTIDSSIDNPLPVGKKIRKILASFNKKPSRVISDEIYKEELLDQEPDDHLGHQAPQETVGETTSPYSKWLKSLKKPSIKISSFALGTENPTPASDNQEITPKSEAKRKKTSKKKKKKKKSKGLLINEEVYSETLADLLAEQGHSKKAIKMYKQLSLIFPEKSALFAVKIEKINRNSE